MGHGSWVMVAEWIAVFLLCGLASAQVGTALVIPMNAAWGDKHEELTLKLQVFSFLAAAALLFTACVIWNRTQLRSSDSQQHWLVRDRL